MPKHHSHWTMQKMMINHLATHHTHSAMIKTKGLIGLLTCSKSLVLTFLLATRPSKGLDLRWGFKLPNEFCFKK